MCIVARRQLAVQLLALLTAVLALACTSGDEPARDAGFYAEVAVEVEPRPNDTLARFGIAEGRTLIRWWHAPDPLRWRWEFETVGSIIDDGVLMMVFDGGDSWEYDDRTNAYRRGILPSASIPAGVVPLPISAPVGPAGAETVAALIAQWRELDYGREVARAGEATLFGRRTQIVELRAASGGVARAFVDPERMFIMRWAVDGEGGGQSYHAEVTALDYDTEIDVSLFAFDPPPGAREVETQDGRSCSSASGPIGGASFPAEPGFLRPAHTPARYHSTATGSESSARGGCGPVAVWALLEGPGGSYILLRQRLRPGGVPRVVRSWQPVDSGLDDAYRHSEGGVLSFHWRDGNVVALLQANAASLEELVRVAESASLVPAAPR